ncbi:MAG TPA: DNA polymerase I [Spirochaetota bacterium]|nr:DNA polymerase I [Spirochaetota bacterium]HOS31713.1 DNA polymerase I [Spirochaetota bacterium]HOS54952.1 DNA polymerase I [Spirochaetota bacterium]HPK61275.1 DNA polymerase I [Spirochaetota bacterium]HQF78802.1 DNA polymerase I [Spirochaetota bacterium]
MKKILLIDSFGIIFKFYYSLRLTNKRGENTSALYGFFSSLLGLLNREKPDYFLAALEGGGKCFRSDIYPAYKANRPAPPEDLVYQIPKIINLLEKLNIPHLYKEGFEADDVIGTVANRLGSIDDVEVLILSSDKDLRQLVNKKVKIYNPSKTGEFVVIDEEYIVNNMGIKPDQVVDYLALRGDASDNIPGVTGIGDKYATDLLQKFGSVEGIYKNIENLSPKIKEKIKIGRDSAFLSKKLATIEKNAPLDLDIEYLRVKPLDLDSALKTLEDESLKSIVQKIREFNDSLERGAFSRDEKKQTDSKIDDAKNEPALEIDEIDVIDVIKENKFYLIKNVDLLREKIDKIINIKLFSFDLETTGLDFFNDKIISISVSTGDDSFVVPITLSEFQKKEADIELGDNEIEQYKTELKRIFEDSSIQKIGHNIKFDLKFLKTFGINLSKNYFDTLLAEYCLDAANNSLGLKELVSKYLNFKTMDYKEAVGDPKKFSLLDVAIDRLVNYSGQDAYITFKLYEYLKTKLDEKAKIRDLFYIIEMELLIVLLEMEYYGVNVDKNYLDELSAVLEKDIDNLTSKMIDTVGEEFNPNSPKQIADILFNKFGLPVLKKTKTGPSTDADVLKKLAVFHPFVGLLLERRLLSKIKSTYADALPAMINGRSGKIHTSFMQTGTQTGRLSSKEPNLQNIPVKTEVGRKIRKAFIPDKGKALISADYSQIELFLLAEFSRDENLFDAFNKGEDIHYRTASLIFNKNVAEVSKSERNIAKTVNFGVLYGQSAFALADDLNIPRKEAANFIKLYFEKYNGVKTYVEKLKAACREKGYAETYWGRIRTIPEINSRNKNDAAYGERMAVNTVIQGTAADLIKIAMIKINRAFLKNNLKARLILQVHDELIFDAPFDEKEIAVKIIKDCMENDFNFKLKLKTSIEIGENWGEFH